MSDDIPPPQSEAPVSDQSQAHPSDRQASAADTQQQQHEKSLDEPSQTHYSDRQAMAAEWKESIPSDPGVERSGPGSKDPAPVTEEEKHSYTEVDQDGKSVVVLPEITVYGQLPGSHTEVDQDGKSVVVLPEITVYGQLPGSRSQEGGKAEETGPKQDQPHPAVQQATAADKQQKPSEKVADKPGLVHPSDRQTTAADKQQKPSEKVADKQSLVQRIKQWEEHCKSEKSRLDKLIAEEKKPNGKLLNQDDPSLGHLKAVVDVVNQALSRSNPPSLEGKQSAQDRLEAARQFVSVWRGESKMHSESLILRDAERYLWARSGVGQFAREKFSGSTSAARAFAETGFVVYDVAKIAAIITGSDYGKANKDLPFSARGGHDWWSLGLQHWDRFDKDSSNTFGDPKYLTYEDMIRYQDALARKHEEDDFNPGRSKWY